MPQPITRHMVAGDVLHEWSFQEYQQYQRTTAWFVIIGTISALLSLLALWRGNFLFLVVLLLFGIILFLQSQHPPLRIPFKITTLGIAIGEKFYLYSELKTFYIVYHPDIVQSLYFEATALYRPHIHVPLIDQNPIEIRDSLLQFLSEDIEKEQEPLSERVARDLQLH